MKTEVPAFNHALAEHNVTPLVSASPKAAVQSGDDEGDDD
jgi:hypothetical protein